MIKPWCSFIIEFTVQYVTFFTVLLLGIFASRICTSKIYGFKGFVASRVCRLTGWSFLSLLLQGSVICYFKGLTFVTSRVCRLLLQGLVVCYFKGLTFVTSRICRLLLQGSVVCYFKGLSFVISSVCRSRVGLFKGFSIQENVVLVTVGIRKVPILLF